MIAISYTPKGYHQKIKFYLKDYQKQAAKHILTRISICHGNGQIEYEHDYPLPHAEFWNKDWKYL